ncbi:MAG: AsmA-like C-terminal region-containing protein, partial [Hyphomicrobiaceae bacterium]
IDLAVKEEQGRRGARMTFSASGVVPRQLASHLPSLRPLQSVDAPVGLSSELDIARDGHVRSGRFDIGVKQGRLTLSTFGDMPLNIESGKFALGWDQTTNSLQLAPSVLEIEGGYVKLAGRLVPFELQSGRQGFDVEMWSLEGALGNGRGVPPLAIEQFVVKSRLWRDGSPTEVRGFALKAGGVEITASGAIGHGGNAKGTRLEGRIGAISATRLKSVWPAGLAPALRNNVIRRLVGGQFEGGTFSVARPTDAEGGQNTLKLAVQSTNLSFAVTSGADPLVLPNALLTVDGDELQVVAPEGQIKTGGGKVLAFKALKLGVSGLHGERKVLELSGLAQGSVASVIQIASQPDVGVFPPHQLPAGIDGKLDAQWQAKLPVAEVVKFQDADISAKVKVTDGRIPDAFGKHDIKGGTFTIAVANRTVEAKGEMLLAGVLAKASGQWLVGERLDRQPPLHITATLDTADRRHLGLGLDDMVQGEVPLEVLITPAKEREPKVQVTADLTGAELQLEGIAWRKPPGKLAKLTFDVVKRKQGKGVELRPFKIAGDSITVDGSIGIGAKNHADQFSFPGFSLDTVTNLSLEGRRGKTGVWEVKARGNTFDATNMIREFYDFDRSAEPARKRGDSDDMNLDFQVENVIGLNDTSLKQVVLRLSERDHMVATAEMTGEFAAGGGVKYSLKRNRNGTRIAYIEMSNAGQALKMVGVYTAMKGGHGNLALDLDAPGIAERSGVLTVRKFVVVGDPVFYEMLQQSDEARPAIANSTPGARRRMVREEIAFNDLRARFSTGNGQIAIQSLTAYGPLVGLSLSGKTDFRSRKLALGGTYFPLSGLNRALSGIPLVREIFTGPRGDGVFGLTFGVSGTMSNPQVIVNPLSMAAPGLLREIFQMAPNNPEVTADEPAATRRRARGARVRSSVPLTLGTRNPSKPAIAPQVIDGWSSKTWPAQ